MSWTYLRTDYIKKARKDRSCDACYLLGNLGSPSQVKEELNPAQLKYYEEIESKGFKILKGEPYMKVTGVFDGEIQSCDYNEEMYKIVEELNLFEE